MRTVSEIESAISRLSPDEMRQVRERLDQQMEDQLEMTTAFRPASNAPNAKWPSAFIRVCAHNDGR